MSKNTASLKVLRWSAPWVAGWVVGLPALVFTAFFMLMLPCYDGLAADTMSHTIEHQIYYQKEIEAFAAQDVLAPPPRGGILFIGSSIFRLWSTLARDMLPLPVLNRAFGGARTWEVLHYMEKIVFPYAPRIIVYYCGSNDIHCGVPARDIRDRFATFVSRVHATLPFTQIIFVSIIKAPQKQEKWDIIDAANTMIKQYCDTARRVSFLDVNPAFFDQRQTPRLELYAEDGLHLRPEAYRIMAGIIKPVLEKAWEEVSGR